MEIVMCFQHRTRILTKTRALAIACVAAAALGACERGRDAPAGQGPDEMAWARAALERNPKLEVLAVDTDTGVFTVRDRSSGEVQAVKVADLAAAPVARLPAGSLLRPAPAEPAPVIAEPLAAAMPAPDDATDASAAQATATAVEPLGYTVERRGDQVRVSGPGVSIVSASAPAATTARGEAGQRTVDPIICEGRHMMHFDNRSIFVDGDAITARNGCELHITNSRIVASRTAVVVRDATVHITNSYIEGAAGSYHAGSGAKIFLRGATLNGVMRRDALAEIQELPGSQWR
ncbi:MAG: hypothetical protein ACRETI_06475 [Steroidobacteraceae bacterium]